MSEHHKKAIAADTKTVTLSDGKVAAVRRPKGRDSIRAHDAAAGENKFKFTCALLAQIVTLDGKPCVIEDIAELYLADIDTLGEAAMSKDFFTSNPASSPS
jgi:hypothetical protein